MKNSFANEFRKELAVEVDFGPIMRFSMKRNRSDIRSFVFVEGSTDRTFYESTSITTLSDHAYYLFRTKSDRSGKDDYSGKEAVYYCLNRVLGSEQLKASIDKCRFIVDRDYDQVKRSKSVNLRPRDYSHVYVTKGHSMESFFIEKSNLEIVNDLMDLNTEEFLRLFDAYLKEMSRFCAYRAVMGGYYKSGASINYRKKYQDEEITQFDFSREDFWIGKPKMLEECERMKRAIARYPYLQRQVDNLQRQIETDRMNLRGHDSFSFLEQYIEQKAHKKIAFPYGDETERREMIGRFRIELTQ